ncbi:hypothetical protein ED733_002093 [Metarhizium rileyi]|uniref:Partial AB-hydrolase lipase domain-containing protein n=1 Tax=Metarhizium rileyi (strain RCEF 4871) TaxID=1649241 RepID=A0A5C6G860_METRR|nr:hypothetical protein ED733_002093 [Metarhizium rileyi]
MTKSSQAGKPNGKKDYHAPGHDMAQIEVQPESCVAQTAQYDLKGKPESVTIHAGSLMTNWSSNSLPKSNGLPNFSSRSANRVKSEEAKGFKPSSSHYENVGEGEYRTETTSFISTNQGGVLGSQASEKPIHSSCVGTHQNGREQQSPSHIDPLFPPLPLYGPPSWKNKLKCLLIRISAAFLSLAFLNFFVLGSLMTSIPKGIKKIIYKLTLRDVKELRLFHEEECRRADIHAEKQKSWDHRTSAEKIGGDQEGIADDYPPTEGGRDKLVRDVGYYARRVGLDVDVFRVRTEDGFLIDLWHVYDPKEYMVPEARTSDTDNPRKMLKPSEKKLKFPVLLMHGLLQSSGAYCSNDDDSLAFWLCKSGFDVWLGNNRCGFSPSHESFVQTDPRMWCWNIRQMGIFDLPALTEKVLTETGFDKLGLVCHSQGTAETLIALSKHQRPSFGDKLTVFCGLAPAAYAGPIIDRFYFRFIRKISPFLFEMVFGVHAFIPFMMRMHSFLSPKIYGWLGYKVFSFMFNWSDARWERRLRNRFFQFAPVYVSAETMRWWLGQDGFAKHRCILSTEEPTSCEGKGGSGVSQIGDISTKRQWYNEQVPPFAMWVCGNDQLVDGRRLLERLTNGEEPHVKMVHSKVIEDYEHLDVIWAINAVDQVFTEIRQVLWKTCHARDRCRVPDGCGAVPAWMPE